MQRELTGENTHFDPPQDVTTGVSRLDPFRGEGEKKKRGREEGKTRRGWSGRKEMRKKENRKLWEII